ncbi:MAG: hypothetical protein ABFS08_12425 [Pseudomonadota bacterium]
MNQDTLSSNQNSDVRLRKGVTFFLTGALLMVGVLFLGSSIESELMSHGLKILEERRDPVMGLILLFAFGFPLGIVFTLVGALLISNTSTKAVVSYFFVGFMLVILTALVPQIFGPHTGGIYFGSGGVIIMIAMVISFWFWAQYRSKQQVEDRKSSDLKALGYVCFGLAAWNTCGLASMPSFGLFPELMIKQGMRPFAVGQAKAIMAYFVIGWLLTAAGMYLNAKSNK